MLVSLPKIRLNVLVVLLTSFQCLRFMTLLHRTDEMLEVTTTDNKPAWTRSNSSRKERRKCNMLQLKNSIRSRKFHGSVRDSASFIEIIALAKVELLLQDPFLEKFPVLLEDCEAALLAELEINEYGNGKFDDIVIKQAYLEELLELNDPERITSNLLKSSSSRKIVPTSIIDIGANIGQSAIPLAKDGHTVYSFEPVVSTCEALKRNVMKENVQTNVNVFCVGIDKEEDTKIFGYYGDDKDKSERYKLIDPTRLDAHVLSKVQVGPVRKFVNADMLDKIHLFKTDTQGNEEAVLRGSYELLSNPSHRPRFVLVEFSHYLLTHKGTEPRTILELMSKAGYVCTHLQYHTRVAMPKSFGIVDTPEHLLNEGRITATFDEMTLSIRPPKPQKKTWKKNSIPLMEEVQNFPGWTDLLCFAI